MCTSLLEQIFHFSGVYHPLSFKRGGEYTTTYCIVESFMLSQHKVTHEVFSAKPVYCVHFTHQEDPGFIFKVNKLKSRCTEISLHKKYSAPSKPK